MENFLISPKEVKEYTNGSGNGYLLVDIREPNEFNDWNIKGSVNIPVNNLIAEGKFIEIRDKLSALPREKFIISICSRGINSQVSASILREMGYNAVSLEKGMKGWNENFDIYKLEYDYFVIVQLARIGKGCLSYIIYSKKDGSAAVVEPSIFIEEYQDYARANGLTIKYVIDTHAHADHFSGGMDLAKKLNLSYYVNEIEVDKVFSFKPLSSLDTIELTGIKVRVLDTPGHTDGSVSFLVNGKALLCGDLLLLESPGRPDLARTKAETTKGAEILYDTLQNVIFKLDDSVDIFPSHFTKTTIRPVTVSLGELKRTSDALRLKTKAEFVNYLTEAIPLNPPNYETIKKFNKAGVIIPLDYAEDLEIGPNRCAAR